MDNGNQYCQASQLDEMSQIGPLPGVARTQMQMHRDHQVCLGKRNLFTVIDNYSKLIFALEVDVTNKR